MSAQPQQQSEGRASSIRSIFMRSSFLALLIIFILAVTSTVGQRVGLGAASTLAGYVALFSFTGAFGGTLRSDLRLLGALGPLMIVATVVPRLLAESVPAVAIALITLVVFSAGLLPLAGPRFSTVGFGVGMASLMAYGTELSGSASTLQIVGASVLGVLLVLLLRVLAGLRDPSGLTRKQIAAVLDDDQGDPGMNVSKAFNTWLKDRPVRWLGDVLAAATSYRMDIALVERHRVEMRAEVAASFDEVLRPRNDRAHRIAAQVRSPHIDQATPVGIGASRANAPIPEVTSVNSSVVFMGMKVRDELQTLRVRLDEALDSAEMAASVRSSEVIKLPREVRYRWAWASVAGVLSWRSEYFRYALRSALGTLLALVLARLLLPPHDPMASTLPVTTFGTLQVSWTATWNNAWQRILGVVAGSLLIIVLLFTVPPTLLPPIGLLGLLLGLFFIGTIPPLGYAGFVLSTVGLAGSAHPETILVKYLLLTALALSIGIVFGFADIPGASRISSSERIAAVTRDSEAFLKSLALWVNDKAADTLTRLLRAYRRATQSRQNLTTPTPDADVQASLQELSRAFGQLFVTGTLVTYRAKEGAEDVLGQANSILEGQSATANQFTPQADVLHTAFAFDAHHVRDLLDQAHRQGLVAEGAEPGAKAPDAGFTA